LLRKERNKRKSKVMMKFAEDFVQIDSRRRRRRERKRKKWKLSHSVIYTFISVATGTMSGCVH